MKKMIIAAAIACVAVFAQAASVQWKTVAMYNDADAKVGTKAKVFVYMIADKTTYDNLTDIWAEYGENVKAGGSEAYNPGGKSTMTSKATINAPNGTSAANTTYYAAIIATIGTGDDMKYYAEKASVLTGDDGNGSYTFGVPLETAAGAKAAWQPVVDVPEPTSGLLLLVGGALLALRRKQK